MPATATPDFKIDQSGNGSAITCPAGQAIRIHSLFLVGIATVSFLAGATALTGAMVIPAGNPVLILPFNKDGWFTLPGGQDFVINTNGQISGGGNWSSIG